MYVIFTKESGKRVAINCPSTYVLEEARIANDRLGTRIKGYGDPLEVRESLDEVIAAFNKAEVDYMEMRTKYN